jgi:osmotically-inducible protein OsmY
LALAAGCLYNRSWEIGLIGESMHVSIHAPAAWPPASWPLRRTWLGALALGALVSGSARAQPTPEPPTRLAQDLQRLLRDEVPGLRDLDLDERLGIVTLSAVAPDLPTRRQAVALVQGTPGVLSVLDLVVVRTRPRPDAAIEEELLHQLELMGPRTSGVTGRVDGGVVYLTGHVRSLALRSEVDDLAAGLGGVREVDDALAVDPLAELPSQHIPDDVAWALPFDSSTVWMVRQGETVTLRGVLLSREQVDRLVQAMMRQPGVKRVVSELEVKNPFEKLPGLAPPS